MPPGRLPRPNETPFAVPKKRRYPGRDPPPYRMPTVQTRNAFGTEPDVWATSDSATQMERPANIAATKFHPPQQWHCKTTVFAGSLTIADQASLPAA
jgi:hypothetical protein